VAKMFKISLRKSVARRNTWVNFINILRGRFCTKVLRADCFVIYWRKNIGEEKQGQVKWWWNWHLPSISSTFYERIFCTTFWGQKFQSWNITRESCSKHFRTKKAGVKCWWNWLHKVCYFPCQNLFTRGIVLLDVKWYVNKISIISFHQSLSVFRDFAIHSLLLLLLLLLINIFSTES